jgi:predicted flap endonuclease-1-like 5' DNA nuclease
MLFFILQTLLLLAIAYILGCVLGCWMHRVYGVKDKPIFADAPYVAPVVAAVAAPVAAAIVRTPEPVAAPEPVAFVAPVAKAAPVAKPKVVAAPKKVAPKPKAAAIIAPAKKDDLKRIKGIGPQNEARLNAFGVMAFAQIASWSKKEEADYGERLAFPGRIEREEWVKQAKVLAKGGTTEFAKRVDKGEVATSIGKGTVGDMGKAPKRLEKARGGKADNLTLIDGVGNAIEKRLFALGIYHFDQIAKMSEAEATWLGNEIGFPGRVQRENWVEESKILAAGGMTDHAKRVESGEIASSRKSTVAKSIAVKPKTTKKT